MHISTRPRAALRALPAVLVGCAVLTGCATTPDSPAPATHATPATPAGPAELTEAAGPQTRLTYTHDGGITTVDAASGETLGETDHEGFLRLNPTGDGRTLLVSAGDEALVYDTAVELVDHGDHTHTYTGSPQLTGASTAVPKIGHVVADAGRTAVFSDGEGTARVYDTDAFADSADLPAPDVVETGSAHHGVAVPLPDGTVLTTAGDTEHRDTVRHVDADGKVLAETHDCPGVHGEAPAAGGRVVFGCEDGPVVFTGTDFTKIPAADGYQRAGTLRGAGDSRFVLADHKTDAAAEHEHPTAVAVIDAETGTLRPVELGASYWFRSLGRDGAGHGLVLTDDGHLKVIDLAAAKVVADHPVIDPWQESENWQDPGPALSVDARGTTAVVTDPAARELVVVDLKTGEVTARHQLEHTPNEAAVTDGRA